MWFTETAWPPILICAFLAAILLMAWSSSKRGVLLIAAAGMVPLSAIIYLVERNIVTEAERIEANVHALAEAVRNDQAERVLDFFSAGATDWRAAIAAAMAAYDVQDDMRITDVRVEVTAADTIGRSHFRANGTVTGKGIGMGRHGATRWVLIWHREGGEWKITGVERYDPLSDERIGLLHPMD